MVWDPKKYKVTGGNVPSNIDPSKKSAASIVTSDGEEIGMEKTNKDGTKTDAISAALEAGRKPNRIQFNPAFESRIEGAKERQAQRAEARKQIVDFKRKEKLETQGKRLDKKVLRRTGGERTNKMSARQAADEVKFGNIAQNLDIKKGERPEGAVDISDGGYEVKYETGLGTQIIGYNSDGTMRYQSK